MTIELNVVGIFFDQHVELGPSLGQTVKSVMDLAAMQSKDPIFRYTSLESGKIVNSITALHLHNFKSRTQKEYKKGIYHLCQTFTDPTPNPYSVWQYYIFDATGKRVPVPAERSYTASTVEDGWKVVWRLVTVCNAPTGMSRRMQHLLPADALSVEMF